MKEPPPYPDTTILIVEVGSTAHGTGTIHVHADRGADTRSAAADRVAFDGDEDYYIR
jgi:hypothetical protein